MEVLKAIKIGSSSINQGKCVIARSSRSLARGLYRLIGARECPEMGVDTINGNPRKVYKDSKN